MWRQQAVFALLERKSWIACVVFEVVLCITLMKRRLLGRYPCLFGLAFVNALRDIGLLTAFSTDSPSYVRAWEVTLPILISVQVATVLEAYTKLTTQYPGLGVFASHLLRWCLAVLVVCSCISAAWDFHHFPQSIL